MTPLQIIVLLFDYVPTSSHEDITNKSNTSFDASIATIPILHPKSLNTPFLLALRAVPTQYGVDNLFNMINHILKGLPPYSME